MSPKASSDFGLYKEKHKGGTLTTKKFVSFVVATVVVLTGMTFIVVHTIGLDEPSTVRAERLVSPKPFGLIHPGQQPSEFTSTTEKVTTLRHPQASNRNHRYFPKNIQDVIGYATIRQSVPYEDKPSAKNFSADIDPFYFFKPKDPGDVNLLATGNVRFAPPSWSNLRNHRKAPASRHRNPLSLTLNVFPDKQREVREHRGRISHRIEHLQPPKVSFPESKPKKMVIYLNLYPEDVGNAPQEVKGYIHPAKR